jgi:CheY-like chemotaxis protein
MRCGAIQPATPHRSPRVATEVRLGAIADFVTSLHAESDREQCGITLSTALVVDDDSQTRSLVRLILETEGYAVVEAAHGEEALGLIGPNPVPDVIVTDLAMPILNGVALIERLESEPRTATIPIVVVSGSDEARALQTSGRVEAVVRKPFDVTAFAECIRSLATT